MSIFIGSALVLTEQAAGEIEKDFGILAYNNILTPSNITATSETIQNPITNVTNPATAFVWSASDASTQTITINSGGSEVDYIGIARHNLNQPGLTVEVRFNGVTVSQPAPVSATQAILYALNIATPTTVEIVISGATEAPKIGVIYVGKSLRLQRKIYVGHTPITYGRNRKTINGMSENGQYLGEIVVRETNKTSVSLSNLTPEWYRNQLDPFIALSPRPPCFFAWRPETYGGEVGYCWVSGNPQPSNQRSNGMMEFSMNLTGIA